MPTPRASAACNVTLALAWAFIPIDFLTMWFVASGMLHCLLIFPQPKAPAHRFPRALYAVHAIGPLLATTGGLLFGGGTVLGFKGAALRLTYLVMGISMAVGLGSVIHTYFTTRRPGVRNQIRWIIWGLIIAIAPWLFLFNLPLMLTGMIAATRA